MLKDLQEQLERLQKQLGYKFSNIHLLRQAVTHKSYARDNYERMEFIGDAILDYVIAINLYQRYPFMTEGELSKMRANLVNKDYLVRIANSISLAEVMLVGDSEVYNPLRSRQSMLADSLEAIFAAVSFDSDLLAAKLVIEGLYGDSMFCLEYTTQKDSKTKLQEYLQGKNLNAPQYAMIGKTGPDNHSLFKMSCTVSELNLTTLASGYSKKEASQCAASEMLDLLLVKYHEKTEKNDK